MAKSGRGLVADWEVVPDIATAEGGQAHLFAVRRAGTTGPLAALKRLKNSDKPARLERFRREVETMKRLADAGCKVVPAVIDADLNAKPPYFVMPWYAQGSLQNGVDTKRYAGHPQDALNAAIRIAEALSEVHQFDVAHRDLKPANIFEIGDRVVLADFGLCLPVGDQGERFTELSEAVGSRFYIAPENQSGLNYELDQRPADFYAFGKTLWALIAGRSPFAREGFREPDWRLSVICSEPKLDVLDGLLEGLLASDVRVRLNDWGVVIAELKAALATLSGESSAESRPPLSTERLRAFVRRPEVTQRRQSVEEAQKAASWQAMKLTLAVRTGMAIAHAELRRLQQASDGEVAFTLGAPSALLDVRDFFPKFAEAEASIAHGDQFLVSAQRLGAPQLLVMTWMGVTSKKTWLASMPLVHWTLNAELPRLVIHERACEAGPSPTYMQQTIGAAQEFGRRVANIFLDLAEHYIELLTREEDMIVGDRSRWLTPLGPSSS